MEPESSTPRITLKLSLNPVNHSYSSETPPTLSVTATLHASAPITLLTWHTALHPFLALRQGAFRLTDLGTGAAVDQFSTMLQRGPVQRLLGGSDDEYFVTLRPETPVTVSTAFGYPVDKYGKPLPGGDEGRLRQATRGKKVPRTVCGVDGLRAENRYALEIAGGIHDALEVEWWKWGVKEEVLSKEPGPPAALGDGDGALTLELEDGAKIEFGTTE